MKEYYVCYINPHGQRLVSVEKANSAEEAERNWVSRANPRCYNLKLVTVTTDRAVMGNFRDGRY